MDWFKDGERNTKFFHTVVKGRRSRLKVSRIQNEQGEWLESQEEIVNPAVEFYKQQFQRQDAQSDSDMLAELPCIITKEESDDIHVISSMEEVRRIVIELNRHITSGPDGMTGAFYQDAWAIIGQDIFRMVQAFFNGTELPRFVTLTNLVLIPKKVNVMNFSDLRPISLSNFVNKIFSRIIYERMKKVLPKMISKEQTGFVQGRSIAENILLVQEIITDIRKRGKRPNMVIKLDMMKAYDRVEWSFLMNVLRKIGFSETLIDMVFKLIENNWYSVLINEQPKGFFKSSRGVKQGDPLSPTLFILAAEVLSRALNKLMEGKEFRRFGMPRSSPNINHLAFADDMIILCKTEIRTMMMVTNTLDRYEKVSGQKIKKEKSVIYMHHSISEGDVITAEVITSILRKEFPFKYLGCPIFYKNKKQTLLPANDS